MKRRKRVAGVNCAKCVGKFQHNTTQHKTTQHNTTRYGTTRHDTTRHGTARHDTTRQNKTQKKYWSSVMARTCPERRIAPLMRKFMSPHNRKQVAELFLSEAQLMSSACPWNNAALAKYISIKCGLLFSTTVNRNRLINFCEFRDFRKVVSCDKAYRAIKPGFFLVSFTFEH
jgi:cation transport ATPase